MQSADQRIALVTLGGLGDAILFSPVLRAARGAFPQAHLTLLAASPLVRDIYAFAPEIDRLTLVDFNRAWSPVLHGRLAQLAWRHRGRRRATLLVAASRQNPRLTRLLQWACGAPEILSNPFPPEGQMDLDVNRALAGRLQPGRPPPDAYWPFAPAADAAGLARVLAAHGLAPDAPLVAVYPSVARPFRARLHPALLSAVAVHATQRVHGHTVVIGSAEEGRNWQALCGQAPRTVNLAGVLTLRETAALLARARLALCNDGGLMHLAGVVECPLVGILPWISRHHRPPGRRTRILALPAPAAGAPCADRARWRATPLPDVTSIGLDALTAEADDLLRATAR